jgi:hypothetical protein
MPEKLHLTDEELLLVADGEISARGGDQARDHLANCPACRVRLVEIRRAAADFARAHRENFNVPPDDIARANLKARLADLSSDSRRFSWREHAANLFVGPRWAYVFGVLLVAALGLRLVTHNSQLSGSPETMASLDAGPLLPEPSLTPGATRPIDTSEVCRPGPADQMASIPVSVRQAVFHEYGMDHSQPRGYEVDHLITPELGGTDDVRNLWPEPYASTEWNAHVKDELEDYLRQRVCQGQLDLSTAQRDMATNWIEAYKKYFHTETPLPRNSELDENQPPTS